MNRRRLIWLLLIPAGLLALVLLMGALADAWLESAGGRRALESRLGQVLDLEVFLDGDFELQLFPTLAAAGSGREIISRMILILRD